CSTSRTSPRRSSTTRCPAGRASMPHRCSAASPRWRRSEMHHKLHDRFLDLSAALTGYSRFRLLGTGQAEPYLSTTREAAGEDVLAQLLGTFADVRHTAGDDEEALDAG